ncbi:ATP/GTP-binding protein [Nautilia sp. PV-1]|uniref:ATP/GTP-binding protein n=1 Tax=Nautilia sp. PV-1 TaxID=2579250 RepID=UPI000FD8D4A7|nr:ATP/GTP-binding protein [Nautilia sp. PV-1]AZV47428.1 ATP/GTP-binding protein [Nautilia sp. PV-1]
MINIDRYGLNSASFDFSFVTSDGDQIELKMYDSIEAASSYKKGRNFESEEFTLKHEYGYEFHYKGNGLSEQDKKEIAETFKKIKPLFEKFIKQKEANEKVMTNTAQMLKSVLPKIKNENHLNAVKHEAVNTFDDILKQIKATLDEVKKAKELFDKIFDKSKKLEIYV